MNRTAQLTLATERGDVWGIHYGVSMLDGCAPEASVPVTVSGQPGRLRVVADPEGSSRTWVQLIWPATLKRPVGVYGLFGWLSRRAVLAMADSMPPVSSRLITAEAGRSDVAAIESGHHARWGPRTRMTLRARAISSAHVDIGM
jgi:hypothetical protein